MLNIKFPKMTNFYDAIFTQNLSVAESLPSFISDQEIEKICKDHDLQGLKLIERDGNCFFRACLVALEEDQEDHEVLRAETVQFLQANQSLYAEFYNEEEFQLLIESLKKPTAWAGELAIQALAEMKKCVISIISFAKQDDRILHNKYNFTPASVLADKEIQLIYVNASHYHALKESDVRDEIEMIDHFQDDMEIDTPLNSNIIVGAQTYLEPIKFETPSCDEKPFSYAPPSELINTSHMTSENIDLSTFMPSITSFSMFDNENKNDTGSSQNLLGDYFGHFG